MFVIKLLVMVVICGTPRSGTSLGMQTLVNLGLQSAAPKWLPEHDNIRQFNPGGYYELDLKEGVQDARYFGKAIKLFGGQLYATPKKYITHLIYIKRNREDAIASYERMRHLLPFHPASSEEIIDSNRICIEKSIDRDTIIVELEDIKDDPKTFVWDLVNYLQIRPTYQQIAKAVNNIYITT